MLQALPWESSFLWKKWLLIPFPNITANKERQIDSLHVIIPTVAPGMYFMRQNGDTKYIIKSQFSVETACQVKIHNSHINDTNHSLLTSVITFLLLKKIILCNNNHKRTKCCMSSVDFGDFWPSGQYLNHPDGPSVKTPFIEQAGKKTFMREELKFTVRLFNFSPPTEADNYRR